MTIDMHALTSVHHPKRAYDELVNAPTLLDEGNERRNAAFARRVAEIGEDHAL